MLKIDSESLFILKKCIGRKVYAFFSDSISFSELEISFGNRELRASFFKDCSFELKSDFFESDCGEMFHDYELRENEPYKEGLSNYTMNSDTINKIEVYGRPFPLEEFRDYPDIYTKYKDVNETDDLFMFHLMNGERIMIVLNDFMPDINLYVGHKMINGFFDNTRSEYSLHHTI